MGEWGILATKVRGLPWPCSPSVPPRRSFGKQGQLESGRRVVNLATDSTDYEIIIINDGSTDSSVEIAKRTAPGAMIINQKNQGLTKALNNGLHHCRGKYIARIDCFDMAYPHRLEKQIEMLENNPDVGAVGGHIVYYEDGINIGLCKYPTSEDEIELEILSGNCPLPHSGATIRKSVLNAIGSYDPFYNGREDFELWSRLSLVSKLRNVDAPIMRILSTPSGISFSGGKRNYLVSLALKERAGKKQYGTTWQNPDLRLEVQNHSIEAKRSINNEKHKRRLLSIFYVKRAGFLLRSGSKKSAFREYFNSIQNDLLFTKAWLGIFRTILIPHKIDKWLVKKYKLLKAKKS